MLDVSRYKRQGFVQVAVHELKQGMYVAALDKPWLDTPFKVQGFYVRSQDDIATIGEHCTSVWIDPRRLKTDVNQTGLQQRLRVRLPLENKTRFLDELPAAKRTLALSTDLFAEAFDLLRRKKQIDVSIFQSAINPLIESVLRNDEVIAALVRMRRKGEYLFNHSLAVSVWAALLGRHLGFERARLELLATGAALLDIGMLSLPTGITLSADELSEDEREMVQRHVKTGVRMLEEQVPDVSPLVLEMVASHHERFDGSGYPRGIENSSIPLFGRIAGLVDTYDAMVTPRPYAESRTSFQAMQELADAKEKLFQGVLVEQFMQAIGIFPTGSVVKLNTGEVGVVVQQNSSRRLRPKVVVVLDSSGNKYAELKSLDLSKYSSDRSKTDLWISQELGPGAFGIDADDYFL